MPEFRRVPELIRVNGKWVFDEFYPTQAAFMWEEHEGKTGTIYAIGCQQFVKIGLTKNFANRRKGIDTGLPFEISTIATRTVPSAGMAYAEAWLHQKFKESRIKGEWFEIGAKEVKAAMALAVKRAAIYERYCLDWHIANVIDRQRPERLEKNRREYEKFLESYPEMRKKEVA